MLRKRRSTVFWASFDRFDAVSRLLAVIRYFNPLPPAKKLPPAQANRRPHRDIDDGCDQADRPPISLFYVSQAVINWPRSRAVVGETSIQGREVRQKQHCEAGGSPSGQGYDQKW